VEKDQTISLGALPKAAIATPRTPRTPKTPVSQGCGRAFTKKFNEADNTSADDNNNNKKFVSPLIGRKRARASKTPILYLESDAASNDREDEFASAPKRVKVEPVHKSDIAGHADTDADAEEEEDIEAFV